MLSRAMPPKVALPLGLEAALESLAREILRQQPPDELICRFAADHFEALIRKREENDEDQSESEPLSSSLQTSRPGEDSTVSVDEPRVLRIETKQVPRPSQAEVVQSDVSEFPDPHMERSQSARFPKETGGVAPEETVLSHFRRSWSLGRDKVKRRGENTLNGDDPDTHQSTFSHSSKEGSPTKDVSTEESPKKDKKKKKGLRTPSFLKKKKEKKKVAEA